MPSRNYSKSHAALLLVGLIPTLSLAGTWTTNPSGNAADIVVTDMNSRIGIGFPNTGTRPGTRLHLAGTGGPNDGIRVSQGFLEVDGVNTYGLNNGGSDNLRIGYFASDRVGFNLEGFEALTMKTNGFVGVGTNDPRTRFNVAGAGLESGAIRITQGFFEVDGVNAKGKDPGGTDNLRIGYFASGRVGFNLQGLEAMSITTEGVFKLNTNGSAGTLTMHGDWDGAKIITGKGQSGNRDLRFVDKHWQTGVETEIARFSSGGHVTFWNRAAVEGKVDGQEAFVVDQKANSGAVVAQFRRNGVPKVTIKDDGDIEAPTGDLHVASVRTATWTVAPDYVFEKDYKLKTLGDVDAFVKKNRHLPEVPSAKDFKEKGMDLAEMNFTLLKKVEELTLYAINQEKRLAKSEKEIAGLKKALLTSRK